MWPVIIMFLKLLIPGNHGCHFAQQGGSAAIKDVDPLRAVASRNPMHFEPRVVAQRASPMKATVITWRSGP
jgi:hypothetical protein